MRQEPRELSNIRRIAKAYGKQKGIKLGQAQHEVAQTLGYKKWAELKNDKMKEEQNGI